MLSIYSFIGALICCLSLTTSQQNRNVYDFKISSWNTNGDRWQSVKHLMDREHIDVMGVQEAGKMPTQITTTTAINSPSLYIIGQLNGRFLEEEWSIEGLGVTEVKLQDSYYLYYFDRTCPTGKPQTKKQNIAMVSKERASGVYLIPPITNQNSQNKYEAECDDRLFVNRPTLGIRIENSFFFTLHTEPRLQNEANLIVDQINQFMYQKHPQATWILMGDFNLTPDKIHIQTNKFTNNMIPIIVSPSVGTRGNRVLDFGILGGPDQQAAAIGSMRVKLLPGLNGGIGGDIASDHTPIEFYKP